jgi:hypothetical protein
MPDSKHKPPLRNVWGGSSPYRGFNEIGWAELHIESVTNSRGEKIWVEPEFLEPASK